MINAIYYDGKSARRFAVTLQIDRHMLLVRGAEIAREAALPQLTIHAPLGYTPRIVEFADGARLEISDHHALQEALDALGYRPGLVARLEAYWRHAAALLLVTLAIIAAAYVWGLPWLAETVAFRIPVEAQDGIDQQLLEAAEQSGLLLPSQLPAQRQRAISQRFMSLRLPEHAAQPSRILFRSSPRIGANAFALPGGSVVVLDSIVALAGNDEEIIAVMAHEAGHVSQRHVLRQMLQASVVGLVSSWYVGDISQLLAAAPATLLETRYSREFERQADDYAARVLVLNDIPASHLADMLEKLERQRGGAKKHGVSDYIASHPATAERIQRLRGHQ